MDPSFDVQAALKLLEATEEDVVGVGVGDGDGDAFGGGAANPPLSDVDAALAALESTSGGGVDADFDAAFRRFEAEQLAAGGGGGFGGAGVDGGGSGGGGGGGARGRSSLDDLVQPPAQRPRLDAPLREAPALAPARPAPPAAAELLAALDKNVAAARGKADAAAARGDAPRAHAFAALSRELEEAAAGLRAGRLTVEQGAVDKDAALERARAAAGAAAGAAGAPAVIASPPVPAPAPARIPAAAAAAATAAAGALPALAPAAASSLAPAGAAASGAARDAAFAELRSALVAHAKERGDALRALASAGGGAGASAPADAGVHAAASRVLAEFKAARAEIDALDALRRAPGAPPCPRWAWRVVADARARVDAASGVPPGGLAVTVAAVVHLRDARGRPEHGDVVVTLRLPVPVDAPATLATPARRLDGEGGARVGYSATLAVAPPPLPPGARGGRAAALSAGARAFARAVERKCAVVTVEVKHAGALPFGLLASTAVVARGALPLAALLAGTRLDATLPLRAPEWSVTEDGELAPAAGGAGGGGGAGARARAPAPPPLGAEGERGALVVELRLHAPANGAADAPAERRVPVVAPGALALPPHPATAAAAGQGRAAPAVARAPPPAAVPVGVPVAAAAAGRGPASAAGSPAGAPRAPAPPPAPSIVAGIDVSSPSFAADGVELLASSVYLLAAAGDAAAKDVEAAAGAYTSRVASLVAAGSSEDAAESAALPLAAAAAAAQRRWKALADARAALEAAAGAGTLTPEGYRARVAAGAARDEALAAALAGAGRAREAAVCAARAAALKTELAEL